jgi:hypothetical protein
VDYFAGGEVNSVGWKCCGYCYCWSKSCCIYQYSYLSQKGENDVIRGMVITNRK